MNQSNAISSQKYAYSNEKDLIGQGSRGNRVYKIKNIEDNKFYALKKIFITSSDEAKYQNEISILKKIDHPNIIKYYESYIQNGKLYLILEYAEGGDLRNIISKAKTLQKQLSEEEIINYFKQIANSIEHLHSNNILHRDIKPENIFLSNQVIKLGDFGISKQLEKANDFTQTGVGTPYYISPEICNAKIYNHKTDIWSLGCLIYELCSFERPFKAESIKALIDNITSTEPKPLDNITYSNELISLIKSMMQKDPILRPDIQEVIKTLMNINDKTLVISKINDKEKQGNEKKIESSLLSPIKSYHQRDPSSNTASKFQSKPSNVSKYAKSKTIKPFIKPEINLNYVNEAQFTNESGSSLQSNETRFTRNSMLSPLNDGLSIMDAINRKYIRQDNQVSQFIQIETLKKNESKKSDSCKIKTKSTSQPKLNAAYRKDLCLGFLVNTYGSKKVTEMLELLKKSNNNPNAKEKLIQMIGKENYAKNYQYLKYILTH